MMRRLLLACALVAGGAGLWGCGPCPVDAASPEGEGQTVAEGAPEGAVPPTPGEGDAETDHEDEDADDGEGEDTAPVEGEGTDNGGTVPPPPTGPRSTDCFGECSYEIINVFPHDTAAFTQGLDFADGYLYEGTGLECCTWLRKVDLETGAVLRHLEVPQDFCTDQRLPACGGRTQNCYQARNVFGEGIVVFGNEIIQLTWKNCVGFVYDRETFAFKRAFGYEHEGWGITHDGQRLIISDGTDLLRFWDPYALVEIGSVRVRFQGQPVTRINELEYIDGAVFANVWKTDYIIRIDPETGNVTARIDLSGILPPSDRTPQTDVLNGIAYDPDNDRLFVTGKRWPKLFEIRLLPRD